MTTFESYRRRREAVYGALRRSNPRHGIAKDLLPSLILLMLLMAAIAFHATLADS